MTLVGRLTAIACFAIGVFVIMEQVARADNENKGCCEKSLACTGCQPCGTDLWTDVGTNYWANCNRKGGDENSKCYDAIPGIVLEVPMGYCMYTPNAKRWSNKACTIKATNGQAVVGPAKCSAPDSNLCGIDPP